MSRAVWLCLALCGGDCYLIVAAALARVINFVARVVVKFAWYFEFEVRRFGCRGIAADLPCAVVVLHINLVASFPIEVSGGVIHRCTSILFPARYERG